MLSIGRCGLPCKWRSITYVQRLLVRGQFMSLSQFPPRIHAAPIAQKLAARVLAAVQQAETVSHFLDMILADVANACEATAAAIYRPDLGKWHERYATAAIEGLDTTCLADANDQDHAVIKNNWGCGSVGASVRAWRLFATSIRDALLRSEGRRRVGCTGWRWTGVSSNTPG